MLRLRLLAAFLLLFAVRAQAGLTEELLRLPAPGRDWRTDPRLLAHASADPPPAEAPLYELLSYWFDAREDGIGPDEATRQRLLAECEQHPRLVASLLGFECLPRGPGTLELLRRWRAAGMPGRWVKPDRVEERIEELSLCFDPANRPALFEKARASHDLGLLEAVAATGTAPAWELLRERALRTDASATTAAALLLRHAPDRDALEALALLLRAGADPSLAVAQRAVALRALRDADWPGREAWWRERIEDPTLREATPELLPLLEAGRERWMPVLTAMTRRSDPHLRAHAATLLLALEEPAPLLDWLRDRVWCDLPDRTGLLRVLQRVKVPDTADALFEIVHSFREGPEAALALGLLGDARAGPSLLERFESLSPAERPAHYEALRACGGIPPEKATGYVVEFLRNDPRRERLRPGVFRRPGSLRLPLGYWILEEPGDLAEPVANGLIARGFRSVAYSLRGATMARDFLARLRDGSLTCEELQAALGNRTAIRAHVEPELRLLTEGEAAGFAAAILEDAAVCGLRLRGDDPAAARALLAAARLARVPLTIEAVRETLARPEVRHAALLYLETIDTPESRRALRAHFADRPLLLDAAREFPVRPPETFEEGLTIPADLLKELGAGALEVFRLEFSWLQYFERLTVRRFANRVEFALADAPDREWFRELQASEWERIRGFVEDHAINELPSYTGGDDEVSRLFVHATPAGATSFSMGESAPDIPESMIYRDLWYCMGLPVLREGFRLRYEQPTIEILFARRDRNVGAFRVQERGLVLCLGSGRSHFDPDDATWHDLDKGRLGPPIADPTPDGPDYSRFESNAGVLTWESSVKVTAEDGTERTLLSATMGGSVSTDRRWLLVSSPVSGDEQMSLQLHLIDLRNFQILPAGRRAHPWQRVVDWIPAHEAFLCLYANGEHFLLDPALLSTRTVEGELRPCHYLGRCQPGATEGTYWAPVHDAATDRWKVGLYDTSEFKFFPVRQVPLDPAGLQQIHVDVRRNLLYVLYDGHLLRMPLRAR